MTKEEVVSQLTDYIQEKKDQGQEKLSLGCTIQQLGITMKSLMEIFGTKDKAEIFNNIPGVQLTERKDEIILYPGEEETVKSAKTHPSAKSYQERIKTILEYLNQNLIGKEEAIRLSLLSAIAGQSIFFLGPPGTAKSMISRRIVKAFSDISDKEYFEYLMNEFSTPEDICGPVSFTELNNDNYVRLTDKKLPKAKVAFLDEIWKSGPAILNTLLTIINEKIYHNGNKIEKVPLVSLAAASNELPQKNRGLEALWDRFILRVFVEPLNNEKDFISLITNKNNGEMLSSKEIESSLFTINEVKEIQEKVKDVELPENVLEVILTIKDKLELLNNDKKRGKALENIYYISDRRWTHIIELLKTSAFLNGRKEVDLMDCSLIKYCVWNNKIQYEEFSKLLDEILQDKGLDCVSNTELIDAQLKDFENYITETWYEKKPAKLIYKTIDGENYIECKDSKGKLYYIDIINSGDGYLEEGGRLHFAGYERERLSNITQTKSKITFTFDRGKTAFPLYPQYTKELEKKESIFDTPAAYKSTKEYSDKEKYQPILDAIKDEEKRLEKIKKTTSETYKANLFADQHFTDSLLSKVDKTIEDLQTRKVSLEELRDQYLKK